VYTRNKNMKFKNALFFRKARHASRVGKTPGGADGGPQLKEQAVGASRFKGM